MNDTHVESEATPVDADAAESGGFQFGLIDIFLVTTIVAITLGVSRAWNAEGGVCVGFLAGTIFAVIRRRTVTSILFLLFLIGLYGVSTWTAWDMRRGRGGYVSTSPRSNVSYRMSDKSYFDAFSCVLFTGDALDRVTTRDRVLILTDQSIAFPEDADVALVNDAGEVRFVTIPDECYTREPPSGGFYMVVLPYPSFRSERTFRTGFDQKVLENASVWQNEILPFLTSGADSFPLEQ